MDDEQVESVIDRFFAAVEAGDLETVAVLYAPDVRVWHSITRRTANRDESLAILRWLAAPGVQRRYETQEQHVVGERVARRHVVTVTVPGHEPVEMPTAIFLTVRGGRIHAIDEYVDVEGTNRLLEQLPLGG